MKKIYNLFFYILYSTLGMLSLFFMLIFTPLRTILYEFYDKFFKIIIFLWILGAITSLIYIFKDIIEYFIKEKELNKKNNKD